MHRRVPKPLFPSIAGGVHLVHFACACCQAPVAVVPRGNLRAPLYCTACRVGYEPRDPVLARVTRRG